MLKTKKIISLIISGIMAISMLGATVNAAESDEKLYTLKELIAMSDEDFLDLEGAKKFYNEIYEDAHKAIYSLDSTETFFELTGVFYVVSPNSLPKPGYKANLTEKQLNYLLDDSIEYDMTTPINLFKWNDDPYRYIQMMTVFFPEYHTDVITEDNIMILSKSYYCINQVLPLKYSPSDVDFGLGPGEIVIQGDVNVDEIFDLYDAIWIAKHLVHTFTLTKGQQEIGDMNGDGVCDLYDVIEIAKSLLNKE